MLVVKSSLSCWMYPAMSHHRYVQTSRRVVVRRWFRNIFQSTSTALRARQSTVNRLDSVSEELGLAPFHTHHLHPFFNRNSFIDDTLWYYIHRNHYGSEHLTYVYYEILYIIYLVDMQKISQFKFALCSTATNLYQELESKLIGDIKQNVYVILCVSLVDVVRHKFCACERCVHVCTYLPMCLLLDTHVAMRCYVVKIQPGVFCTGVPCRWNLVSVGDARYCEISQLPSFERFKSRFKMALRMSTRVLAAANTASKGSFLDSMSGAYINWSGYRKYGKVELDLVSFKKIAFFDFLNPRSSLMSSLTLYGYL